MRIVAVLVLAMLAGCATDVDPAVSAGTVSKCGACASDVDCTKGLHCDHSYWICRPAKPTYPVCDAECAGYSSECAASGKCHPTPSGPCVE